MTEGVFWMTELLVLLETPLLLLDGDPGRVESVEEDKTFGEEEDVKTETVGVMEDDSPEDTFKTLGLRKNFPPVLFIDPVSGLLREDEEVGTDRLLTTTSSLELDPDGGEEGFDDFGVWSASVSVDDLI